MTAARKVLCNGPQFGAAVPDWAEPLRAAGFELVINDTGRVLSEAELLARLPGAWAAVAHGEVWSDRVMAAAPDLRVIARYGVGWDKVDLAAATRRNIAVAMAFGANHETVADLAVGMALTLACNILPNHRLVAGGGWHVAVHPGLWGGIAGIVGLGRIGQAVARRLAGFRMTLLGYDPVAGPVEGVERVGLDELLAHADLVTLHVPLGPETRNLIGARELGLMKPTAFLINTARGGLIDEAALHQALTSGRLAGAGLDVFEREPPAGSPLLGLENVVLAPHVGGADRAAQRLMGERCVTNILALHAGRDPGDGCLLNPEVLATWAA